MKIFKRLFCKHEWNGLTWSLVECKKCGHKKRDPVLAFNSHAQYYGKMIDAGHWNEDEVVDRMVKSKRIY